MPAKSKAQQKFMGIVRSIQTGDAPASKFSKKARDAAKDMKKKDVEDFASTKHKGKPEKVKQETKVRSLIRKMVREIVAEIEEGGPGSGPHSDDDNPFDREPSDAEMADIEKEFESVDEDFAGSYPKSMRNSFDKKRQKQSEVLGYKLTGTPDIKTEIGDATVKEGKFTITKSRLKEIIKEELKEDSLGDKFQKTIQRYQDKVRKEKEAYRKARELQKKRKKLTKEVDFGKVKLPSQVNRFLDRFVQSMKDANLNRIKRSAILAKVISASGMSPQQLMADIQKIKRGMK